jgi:hypothetical protein
MRIAGIVSQNEREILLTIGFATFILAVVSFVTFTIENYNREVKIQPNQFYMAGAPFEDRKPLRLFRIFSGFYTALPANLDFGSRADQKPAKNL